MAALELYELNNKINQQISKLGKNEENSVFFTDECYLIQENWFLKYKNFYLNNEIYQSIFNEKKLIKIQKSFLNLFQKNSKKHFLINSKISKKFLF